MTEERLREIERTRCTRVYLSPDDVPELIAEIRRLQAELTEVQIDRNNYELLNRLKIVTIEKQEAELARLRPAFEAASKFVEAVEFGWGLSQEIKIPKDHPAVKKAQAASWKMKLAVDAANAKEE